jgi:hypothetical protein
MTDPEYLDDVEPDDSVERLRPEITVERVEPRYPDIHLQLTGEDGNAFGILGRALREMRNARLDASTQEEFLAEAKSGDYDHLLLTCLKWFTCH